MATTHRSDYKDIAVAGKEFFYTDSSNCIKPRGRVCAFTQAFHTRDLQAGNGRNNVAALISNAVAWANITKGSNIAYFDTEDTEFNAALETLLTGTVTKLSPFYTTVSDFTDYNNKDLYILFPNYNAQKGNHMPDNVQQYLINRVKDNAAGLVLGEWFHFMQSVNTPTKRSFSFRGDGTIIGQAVDDTKGLFTLSPLSFGDFIDIDKPTKTNYIKNIVEDDMSYRIPPSFPVRHTFGAAFNTTGYDGIFSSVTGVQPEVIATGVGFSENHSIFYYRDDIADVTDTTTSTTTAAPVQADIKLKVAEISEDSSCGPMKRTISGQHANLFEIEGNSIYLIKNPSSRDNYKIKIKYEDLFSPKRFDDFYKDINLPIRECGTPLSEPLGDYNLVWGWDAGCREAMNSIAGSTVDRISHPKSSDYSFSGEGTPEIPIVAELGGTACSQNVMWIQVNEAGTLSYELSASSDCQDDDTNVYCSGNDQANNRTNADWGNLYLASGVNLYPRQHSSALSDSLSYGDDVTVTPIIGSSVGVAGKSLVRTGSSPFPINFNPSSTNKVFILFVYSKDKSISLFEDKVKVKLLLGTTLPPDPIVYQFTVFLINRVTNTNLSSHNDDRPDRRTIVLKRRAGENIVDNQSDPLTSPLHVNDLDISLVVESGFELLLNPQYTIIPSTSPVSITVDGSNKNQATIGSFAMPVGGGSATVYIDGEATAIPTTTPAPQFTYSLVFQNHSATTRFVFKGIVIEPDPTKTYTVNYTGPVGTGGTRGASSCSADYLTYQVLTSEGAIDPSREYRDDDAAGSYFPYISLTDNTFAHSTATHQSCSSADPDDIVDNETFGGSTFKYCKDNDGSFDVTDGVRASYGRTCNTSIDPFPIRIDVPDIPDGGGTAYIRIDGLPVNTTTTPAPPTTSPPTTTPAPCDDLILVQCEQTLDCNPASTVCSESLSSSTNTLKFVTCCPDLTEATIISRVYLKKIGSTIGLSTSFMKSALETYYANKCPAIPTEAFTECQAQESNGSCVDQVSVRTIDALSCEDASYNPLP